jgi:hypothetical protein
MLEVMQHHLPPPRARRVGGVGGVEVVVHDFKHLSVKLLTERKIDCSSERVSFNFSVLAVFVLRCALVVCINGDFSWKLSVKVLHILSTTLWRCIEGLVLGLHTF